MGKTSLLREAGRRRSAACGCLCFEPATRPSLGRADGGELVTPSVGELMSSSATLGRADGGEPVGVRAQGELLRHRRGDAATRLWLRHAPAPRRPPPSAWFMVHSSCLHSPGASCSTASRTRSSAGSTARWAAPAAGSASLSPSRRRTRAAAGARAPTRRRLGGALRPARPFGWRLGGGPRRSAAGAAPTPSASLLALSRTCPSRVRDICPQAPTPRAPCGTTPGSRPSALRRRRGRCRRALCSTAATRRGTCPSSPASSASACATRPTPQTCAARGGARSSSR